MTTDATATAGTMPPRMLYWKRDLMERLGVSRRTLERMISTGEIPRPEIRLRGRGAWRTDTITDWIADGCPRVTAAGTVKIIPLA
ncbi:MAG: hypothetical protein V1809_03310 [Planctomycetota bacterium]